MASNRLWLKIECGPLGNAHVVSADIEEAMSTPTLARVTVRPESEVALEDLVDADVTLTAVREDQVVRGWHFKVTRANYEGIGGDGLRYSLELEHPLARLKLRTDVRLFQEMDGKAIVEQVFTDAGIPGGNVSWTIGRTPAKRIYCKQHVESDFDFASRLLEHEGIFYFLDQDESAWKLVLGDAKDAFEPIQGESDLPLVQGGVGDSGIHDFQVEHSSVPDEIVLRDWNYETPGVDLTGTYSLGSKVESGLYEFPGGFQAPGDAEAIAKVRGEEIASRLVVGQGRSDRWQLASGHWFNLTDTARESLAVKWLVRRVRHSFAAASRFGGSARYTNQFDASPLEQPYRPTRSTRVPVVHGSESVKVSGPSGEEIYTDSLGRMKGKFFWDRTGTDPGAPSCWMRVLQTPIGGSMALARVGWEMSVRFQYGDPDRPIAISRVDNSAHTAPYSYPAAASAMSFKTLSSPGGAKFNEFTMEDGGGGMKVGVTAAKDWTEQVNNNKTEKIGVDEKLDVGVNLANVVASNQTIDIGAAHMRTVSSDSSVNVKGDRSKTVGAAETVTVSGSVAEKITGSDSETVGASRTTLCGMGVSRTSTGDHSLTVGAAMVSAAAMGCSVAVAGSRSETVGAAKLVLAGGAISETVVGAAAITVGGVCLSAAGGNRNATAKGSSAVTVGGVVMLNAGGKVQVKAKTIKITVLGVANLLGGGGLVNMTPGSIAFAGLVTLKAPDGVKISGAPNLLG